MFESRSTRISQDQIDDYARLSGDFNPLHVDPDYAATTPFGGTIAHGSIPMNSILRSLALLVGSSGATGVHVELKLIGPSRPGDVITSAGEQGDDATWQVRAENQRGELVMVGIARISGNRGQL